MKNNLNDLIKNSVKVPKPPINTRTKTQADILVENADKALGIDHIAGKNKREISVTNQTFSVTQNEVDIINATIKRFLKHSEVVNKSEIIRISLQLIKSLNDAELMNSLDLIERKSKNGW